MGDLRLRMEAYGRLVKTLLENLKETADAEVVLALVDANLEAWHEAGIEDAESVVRSVAEATRNEAKRVSTILADRLLDLRDLNKRTSRLYETSPPASMPQGEAGVMTSISNGSAPSSSPSTDEAASKTSIEGKP